MILLSRQHRPPHCRNDLLLLPFRGSKRTECLWRVLFDLELFVDSQRREFDPSGLTFTLTEFGGVVSSARFRTAASASRFFLRLVVPVFGLEDEETEKVDGTGVK